MSAVGIAQAASLIVVFREEERSVGILACGNGGKDFDAETTTQS